MLKENQETICGNRDVRVEELFPNSYKDGVTHMYICMEPGAVYKPDLYEDKIVIISVSKGRGYITDTKDAYNIEEICFYFPEFKKTPYQIHSITKMECIITVIEMNEWDRKLYDHTRDRLPLFRTVSKCSRIDECFRTPGTFSFDVLGPHQLGRISVGAVLAANGEGTKVTCDPYATEWLFFADETDANMTINGRNLNVGTGEFFMISPDEKYSIFSKEKKCANHIWIKHFTRPRDFKINPMPSHFNH